MPIARLAGAQLNYEVSGAGPPVLMVMGTGASGRAWELHQVPALVAAGFRVITFDNRGVPPSTATGDFDIDDLVADTAGLIEHLDLGPCHVVGMSLGARIAQELALVRPDLVERLVFMATRGRLDRMRAAAAAAEMELWDSGAAVPPSYRAVTKALHNLSPHTLADDARIADWLEIFEMTLTTGEGVRTQLQLSSHADRLPAYRGITAPCRVIAFGDDLVSPPHLGAEVADAVPDCDFRLLENCGHYGYLERPTEVNRLLTEFLTGSGTEETRADRMPQLRTEVDA